VRGPYGGAAAVGPRGGYAYRGHAYRRPAIAAGGVGFYGRRFVGYPGWRAYGTWGLVAGLAAFSSLAFLSNGYLVGSYPEAQRTLYVYVVEEDGQNVQYVVDSQGSIISREVLGEPTG
jgi:hypothetical protein